MTHEASLMLKAPCAGAKARARPRSRYCFMIARERDKAEGKDETARGGEGLLIVRKFLLLRRACE